ncbi:hypothetical protein AB0G15_11670 [Streptosporangium sp. NPDC023825]|uniref:hypothetical protein n=1 Tax=Streptosporangium sp. NPDC023825 TaxID=3154909 RepID=UPI00342F37F9
MSGGDSRRTRAGADIVLVSESLGHASLNSIRIHTLSTAADRVRALSTVLDGARAS